MPIKRKGGKRFKKTVAFQSNMKPCTSYDFETIVKCFGQRDMNRGGSFSVDAQGILILTLRERKMPVFPNREHFLEIEGGGIIPLEQRLDVVADSISKPKWEVYAIYDPTTNRHYYDYQNLYLQSMIEGEDWQKQEE